MISRQFWLGYGLGIAIWLLTHFGLIWWAHLIMCCVFSIIFTLIARKYAIEDAFKFLMRERFIQWIDDKLVIPNQKRTK